MPPPRPYGRPVSGEAISQNLTIKSTLQRGGPALEAYRVCGIALPRHEADQRAAREMQVQALAMQTDRLRQVNAASARYREQMNLQGINPNTAIALVMLSRPHLRYGWLHLQPGDWRAPLDRQIEERDRLHDITHSGPAPAFVACVDEQQMPKHKTAARDLIDAMQTRPLLILSVHSIGKATTRTEQASAI